MGPCALYNTNSVAVDGFDARACVHYSTSFVVVVGCSFESSASLPSLKDEMNGGFAPIVIFYPKTFGFVRLRDRTRNIELQFKWRIQLHRVFGFSTSYHLWYRRNYVTSLDVSC